MSLRFPVQGTRPRSPAPECRDGLREARAPGVIRFTDPPRKEVLRVFKKQILQKTSRRKGRREACGTFAGLGRETRRARRAGSRGRGQARRSGSDLVTEAPDAPALRSVTSLLPWKSPTTRCSSVPFPSGSFCQESFPSPPTGRFLSRSAVALSCFYLAELFFHTLSLSLTLIFNFIFIGTRLQ